MDYPGKVITKTQVTPTQTSASGNWTLDDQAAAIKNNNWPVALVPNPISKSLRFNSADSAYLNRTPAGSGTLGVWTFSFWVKRAALGVTQTVFFSGTTNQRGGIRFTSGDLINCQPFNSTGANASWTSTAVYRDPSAWYHVVIRAFSSATGNSFGGVELALYINGVQQTFTLGTTGTPTGGDRINDSQVKHIGQITPNGDGDYLSAYLTEFNFIDGQALTPSSFGMTNPQTGQWIPLKYSGTYGTNGFYLNFKDATSTTTLGYDYSGNANNWTTNNFSVTAGAGNDSLTDVPTPWFAYNTTGDVGGVIRGNYATLNPLRNNTSNALSNGNLDVTSTTGNFRNTPATIGFSSGKWYWEVLCNTVSGTNNRASLGISTNAASTDTQVGSDANSHGYYNVNGNKYFNGSNSAYGASYSSGDVIGFALDMDAGTLVAYKNNASQGTLASGLTGTWFPAVSILADAGTTSISTNFGQRPFAYTPPTGFRSLCTTNLPATAIGFGLTNQGDDYFNTIIWTGNNNSTGTTRTQTGVGFQPDFVWIKNRSNAYFHNLYDSVRGSGSTKNLSSNTTGAEGDSGYAGLYGYLSAFNSDGFQTTNGTDGANSGIWVNAVSENFVAWNWKAGGTGVTNTAGTITSTVSANTTAGFSIVTYTGNNTTGATIGHGLGVAPSMIIIKDRLQGTGYNWNVYHASIGNTQRLFLDATSAAAAGVWNNTSPTSTVFTLTNNVAVNGTDNYVAYCFAPVPGYSAFGTWTNNNSTSGTFTYLGFRPRFIMLKNSDNVERWFILDTSRLTFNVNPPDSTKLVPNSSAAEGQNGAETATIDFLSNGFKIMTTNPASGEISFGTRTYIYAAFAESPFQFANAR